MDGFASIALGVAEQSFPVLEPVQVVDRSPLVRPPALPAVPRLDAASRGRDWPALAGSAATLLAGVVVLGRGRRPRGRRGRSAA